MSLSFSSICFSNSTSLADSPSTVDSSAAGAGVSSFFVEYERKEGGHRWNERKTEEEGATRRTMGARGSVRADARDRARDERMEDMVCMILAG